MHYTVVVDFEMCNVNKSYQKKYHFGREIIQIGATCLDENYDIVDGFNFYVRPEYGAVDDFIQNLTGINYAKVAKVESLDSVLDAFTNWLPDDVTMASWSMNDRKQYIRETEEKQIRNERLEGLLEDWVDCQVMFAEKMDNHRQYRLEEALIAADIDYLGKTHDGASDSYNTALLFRKMMTQPTLQLNKYYENARAEQTESLTASIGYLFSGIDLTSLAVA